MSPLVRILSECQPLSSSFIICVKAYLVVEENALFDRNYTQYLLVNYQLAQRCTLLSLSQQRRVANVSLLLRKGLSASCVGPNLSLKVMVHC